MSEQLDFESHGLRCAIRKGPVGHWCGYVEVDKTHPWHGKDYDADVTVPNHVRDRTLNVDKIGIANLFFASGRGESIENGIMPIALAVDVHGGLTYASNHEPNGDDKGNWWFGFDCAHVGDAYSPELENERDTYRDYDYVRSECESLAKQLTAFKSSPTCAPTCAERDDETGKLNVSH